MEENNFLVKSFENSIGIDIAELAGNTLEFCIDTCIEDDSILKDVPFLGATFKLYSIGSKIHDKHSFCKFKAFIQAINSQTSTDGELEDRRQKFIENAKFRNQELEYLLILIERYIGFEKPYMLGQLYVAYIDSIITWDEMSKYAEVVDRFLPGDYQALNHSLLEESTQDSNTIDATLRLLAMGLVAQRSGLITEYDEASKGLTLSDAKGYVITSFGKKLKQILDRTSPLINT